MFVQVVSPVTLMLLGKTTEPNLLDENTPKYYEQKADTVRYEIIHTRRSNSHTELIITKLNWLL